MSSDQVVLAAGSGRGPDLNVLLIDDQPIVGEQVRRMLANEADLTFHYCSDPTRALSAIHESAPTVLLLDLTMPEIDGLQLLRAFQAAAQTRDIPTIILSSKEDSAIKAEAFALGACDYLVKLPDAVELIARIRRHSMGYIHLPKHSGPIAPRAPSWPIWATNCGRR
jgi:PleD family two-component response regulator